MKKLLLIFVALWSFVSLQAQRTMESLDRGLVAVQTSASNVYLSWRILGEEWYDVTYNVYRDGTKLNTSPLTTSNYVDVGGSSTAQYSIRPVVRGVEQSGCDPVTAWNKQYMEIPMQKIYIHGKDCSSLFELNDACAADLDGDGQYEIIIKRMNNDWSVANDSAFTIFQAYKLDGTLLWSINCGPNLVSSGNVETDCVAYDFNGDGKAEVVMRAADGTVLPDGTVMGTTEGTANMNYRSYVTQSANMQYSTQGNEYLVVMDHNGKLLDYTSFIPRGSASDWGDGYGHRANKFYFGAPYLDGRHPSIYIGRGCYTQVKMRTYDLDSITNKLKLRWSYECTNSGSKYYGQGYHNFSIVDVDGDGCDEICHGNMVINNDGKEKSSTGLGHGDAQHYGDFDPYRKGIEGFRCLEDNPGAILVDANTNEILMHWTCSSDCGRAMAANTSENYLGAECISAGSPGVWSATTSREAKDVVTSSYSGMTQNFRIFWDGDELDETFDYTNLSDVTSKGYGTPAVFKYGSSTPIFTATGTATDNYTKGNPCLQADLFGDWREEMVLRTSDNSALRIYTTVLPTTLRNYTLMHDYQYRQAVYWQMCAYNQPPHVSYFLGKAEGIMTPPPPTTTLGRTEVNKEITSADNSKHVLLCNTSGDTVTVDNGVTPYLVTVNSPKDYKINGILSGAMRLVKQGNGALTLSGTQTYTGETNIWGGTVNFNGTLNSPVWMNRFSEMNTSATFNKGIAMEYGAILRPGGANAYGTVTTDSLHLRFGAVVEIDLNSTDTTADVMKVGKLFLDDYKTELSCGPVFQFVQHNRSGESTPSIGKYLIMQTDSVEGNLSDVTIMGMSGINCNLEKENKNIYLVVNAMRASAKVYWDGSQNSGTWDLATTTNFMRNGSTSDFVTNDTVNFDDNASVYTVNLPSEVVPTSVTFNNNSGSYTLTGNGYIGGTASFTKTGTGTLYVNNTNSYSGKTLLSGGVTKVASLATSQLDGSLGTLSTVSSNFEMTNGANLLNSAVTTFESPVTMSGSGGVINCAYNFEMKGAVYGTTLTKKGTGTLSYYKSNTVKKSVIQSGTLNMHEDASTPGDTVEIQSGTLQDNNNSYSYNTRSYNIIVPAGKNAYLNLDGRAYYTGKLFGSGNLYVSVPYVRTQLQGDWSAFTGLVQPTNTTYGFTLDNGYGLPNATLNIPSGVTVTNSGKSFKIGALTGSGTLGGYSPWLSSAVTNTWNIGNRTTDFTFGGVITGASIVNKTDSCTMTVSNASDYTGATTIVGGSICLNNSSATSPMLGTGTLTVNNGAMLCGAGLLGNSSVTVKSGATVRPGTTATSMAGTLKFNSKNVTFASGSKVAFYVASKYSYTRLSGIGSLTMNGTVTVSLRSSYAPADGDSLVLWQANSYVASSTPAFDLPVINGYAWDTSDISQGILRIKASTGIQLVNNNEQLSCTIFTTGGAVVGTFVSTYADVQTNLNKTAVAPGAYIIRMKGSVGSASQKFIKP